MKSSKMFWTFVMAGALMAGGLTACGKKDDSSVNTYGNMSWSGSTATSNNISVAGIPLQAQISNVGIGSYASSYSYNPYSTGASTPTLRFNLSLNGLTQSYPLATAYSYTTTAAGAWSQPQTQGQFLVWYASMCSDASCQNGLVTVLVTAANNPYVEYHQFAVKANATNGTVNSSRDFAYSYSSVQSGVVPGAQALIYQF